MSETRHLYTLEEARAMLPRVIPILKRMVEMAQTVRGQQAAVAAAARGVTADGHALADPFAKSDAMEGLKQAFDEALGLMRAWGIEIKDAERGLIDFYAERDGDVVYLCFLLGEEDIRFWHTLEGGFAGRRRL